MALFVHHTFTGPQGLLTSNAGEIGAVWTAPAGGSYNGPGLQDVRLNGAGAIQLAYEGVDVRWFEDALASGVPPGADYYAEVDFTAAPPTGGNNCQISLYMRANGAYPNFIEVSLMPTQSAGGGGSLMWIGDASTSAYSATASGPVYSGAHTFRAEVEGLEARGYIDGVMIGSFPVSALPAGSVGFGFGTDGPDSATGMVLNEFRAGTLGGAPLPSLFWTANVKATEVIA